MASEDKGKIPARKLWKRASTATASHHAEGHHKAETRAVTLASATLVTRDQVRRVGRRQDWQAEAWDHYEAVGELGFAAQWIARALSRCKLMIGEVDPSGAGDPSAAESPPEVAQQLLDALYDRAHGEMLRRMGVHLTIPGETYLIGMDDPDQDPVDTPDPGPVDVGLDDTTDDDEQSGGERRTRWIVASTEEFTYQGNKARVQMPEDGRTVEINPSEATIIRIWQPHPRKAWEADSSVRYCRAILREINGLTQRIQADIDSRLAGAGLLAIPHSTTMPQAAQSDTNGGQPLHDDPFVSGLIESMVTPIRDRDDASAVVPIVIKVPDEAIGKIQHISFATDFDGKITELRDSAIRRLAGSADLPGEIITGLGDTNHWNSWTISDQATSLHVEPLLGCIAQALTSEFLRPGLRAAGHTDAYKWCIWYDTSELTQRPDRSTEAQALYDKGELSGEALLRENGFNPDTDAPDDEERLRWVSMRIVLQRPELLPALALPLGLPLTPQAEQDISDTSTATSTSYNRTRRVLTQPTDATSTTSNNDSSRPEPPAEPGSTSRPDTMPSTTAATAASADWLLAAAETCVYRALELAGKRLRNTGGRKQRHRDAPERNVHPWDIHTVTGALDEPDARHLLNGAFDLAEHTIPAPCVRDTVETYTLSLLCSGQPHRHDQLADMLNRQGCTTDTTDSGGESS